MIAPIRHLKTNNVPVTFETCRIAAQQLRVDVRPDRISDGL
jgi:hypothetical protein